MAGKVGLLVAGFIFLFSLSNNHFESTGMLSELLPIAMDVGVQVCLRKDHIIK